MTAATPSPELVQGSTVYLKDDHWADEGPWVILDTEETSRHMVLCLRKKYYPRDLYRSVWLRRDMLSPEPWPPEPPRPPAPAKKPARPNS
ncbi:MAG: hypothetical protein NZ821_08870 [Gloeomargarita sp. SKYB31]|nr:hypothetical protein [Gloeomargarita sp. SKYG98]MCS7227086.1 hypothetical protein [Gloeomargarita sp. SKYB31]